MSGLTREVCGSAHKAHVCQGSQHHHNSNTLLPHHLQGKWVLTRESWPAHSFLD